MVLRRIRVQRGGELRGTNNNFTLHCGFIFFSFFKKDKREERRKKGRSRKLLLEILVCRDNSFLFGKVPFIEVGEGRRRGEREKERKRKATRVVLNISICS